MRILSAWWLVVLFTLVVISPAKAEDLSSAVPNSFRATIGGFLGRSSRVELRGKRLVCTVIDPSARNSRRPRRTVVVPSEAQWREFRQTLGHLGVWRWQPIYPSRGVIDGTQWEFAITYPDHTLSVQGDNNYPASNGEPNGKPEPTKAFEQYLNAMAKPTSGIFDSVSAL